jgi:hypothetical protein
MRVSKLTQMPSNILLSNQLAGAGFGDIATTSQHGSGWFTRISSGLHSMAKAAAPHLANIAHHAGRAALGALASGQSLQDAAQSGLSAGRTHAIQSAQSALGGGMTSKRRRVHRRPF